MNRTKGLLNRQDAKAVKKAVRAAQVVQPKEKLLKSNMLTPKKMEKGLREKSIKKKEEVMESFHKHLKMKKAKQVSSHSKRTSPGLPVDSTPKSVHVEGGRWMKTVVKQSVSRGKSLSKKLSKK